MKGGWSCVMEWRVKKIGVVCTRWNNDVVVGMEEKDRVVCVIIFKEKIERNGFLNFEFCKISSVSFSFFVTVLCSNMN